MTGPAWLYVAPNGDCYRLWRDPPRGVFMWETSVHDIRGRLTQRRTASGLNDVMAGWPDFLRDWLRTQVLYWSIPRPWNKVVPVHPASAGYLVAGEYAPGRHRAQGRRRWWRRARCRCGCC